MIFAFVMQALRIYKNSKLVKINTVCVHQLPAKWSMLGDWRQQTTDSGKYALSHSFPVFSTASLFGDSILDTSLNVRPSWSGAWFNPDQPGHGISVEVLDDRPLWLIAKGSTDLVRLTSLYDLNGVDMQEIAGRWEVQFGYATELKYPVEIVAAPDAESPDQPDLLSFEFPDEADCLWSGQLQAHGF